VSERVFAWVGRWTLALLAGLAMIFAWYLWSLALGDAWDNWKIAAGWSAGSTCIMVSQSKGVAK
jgi:hypothetical protein